MNNFRVKTAFLSLLAFTALFVGLGRGTVPTARAAERKLIAITFDDGPSRYTEELLDGLAERGAHATFFITGVNGQSGAEHYPELLTRMWEEGHQLGNHTYNHITLTGAGWETIRRELQNTQTLIEQAIGGHTETMLRAPGGLVPEKLRRTADAPFIHWSVDTLDWKRHDEDRIFREIVRNAQDGAVVLLHDNYAASVAAALRAVDALEEEYEFVTVSELLRRRGAPAEPGTSIYSVEGALDLPAYVAPTVTFSEGTAELCSPDGLPVYYTLDGRFPTLSDGPAEGPVPVTPGTELIAVGVDGFGTRTPALCVTVGEEESPNCT